MAPSTFETLSNAVYEYPIAGKSKQIAVKIAGKSKEIAGDAAYVSKKLLRSTGKAAFIAGTSALILLFPLVILMDREAAQLELEYQQANLLGIPTI